MGTYVQTETFDGTKGSPKPRKGHGDGATIRVGYVPSKGVQEATLKNGG
ncbi:hypothetical protein Krac_1181 [Ktedonobacter racemifer DSM 44963]|uniref:Uncharacterized protein n=1 Tax=Ktedonobacter racemifer DSM 44963 TaxID=485913 RepID=D6U6F5_KTERA|nr:hypothetical protein Krac_1181 [Ktedonobacter racemifer DSM 44963]